MFTLEELRTIRGMADKRYNQEKDREKSEIYKKIAISAQNEIIRRTNNLERYRKSDDLT